jgi:hypothetical protein
MLRQRRFCLRRDFATIKSSRAAGPNTASGTPVAVLVRPRAGAVLFGGH